MNISPSQYNSGCESGWTSYLDQSSYLSQSQFQKPGGFADYVETKEEEEKEEEEEEEEEEDLSMVSDASSGPPHYHDFDEDCVYEDGSSFSVSWGSKLGKKSKKKSKGNGSRELHLDDTASSPKKLSTNFSKDESSMQNVLGYSEGFSATHKKVLSLYFFVIPVFCYLLLFFKECGANVDFFQGKSALLQHFGFLKSSLPKSPASQKPGMKYLISSAAVGERRDRETNNVKAKTQLDLDPVGSCSLLFCYLSFQ
ncbi:hypothetical protein DVH24_012571 [Malus domestica]|uniref:Uncharacterized protein n=1 Tax=Malus domestica TaxID=3750 RepID=A0A498HTS6_MALDO|nr:hypothetical protein DVH24_012571 [Malus domestica]